VKQIKLQFPAARRIELPKKLGERMNLTLAGSYWHRLSGSLARTPHCDPPGQ